MNMRKSPDNFQTLQVHPHVQVIPLKSSTSHKVPYLPTLGFRFDEVILSRLNSQNREQSKSIFFLKGGFKRDHSRYRHRFHENYTEKKIKDKEEGEVFPQVSLSTTLDTKEKSPKRKPLKRRSYEEVDNTCSKDIESINLYIKKRVSNHSQNTSQQTSLNRTQYRPKIIKLDHEKKRTKQQSKLDEMIIGNKTILNFRELQTQGKKTKNNNNKNQLRATNAFYQRAKIKFDTFYHQDKHDLSPWIFTDRFDENT